VLAAIRSARIASGDDALLNRAESGIDLAISRLAADPEWRGAEAVPVPGGTCSVSVARADDGGFKITACAATVSRKGRERLPRTCTVRVRVEESGAETPAFAVSEWDASFEPAETRCSPPPEGLASRVAFSGRHLYPPGTGDLSGASSHLRRSRQPHRARGGSG
jgi:hypothetical protein